MEQQPDEYLIYASRKTEKESIESLRVALKTVWDSLKIIIEILKSNKKLEESYKSMITKAFDFCEKYNRRT